MSASPTDRRDTTEPGPDTRGHLSRVWDVIFDLLRFIARYAHNVYATFGIFVLIGAAFALAGTWAFAMLAGHVTSGGTQAFDDAVLQWLGARRAPCHHLRRRDRRLHHLHQPALPGRPLSIRRPCRGHHRPRLGRLLHGDSRGNPALCSPQRAAAATRRAPRACARVLAELPMLGHSHLLAHIQHWAR